MGEVRLLLLGGISEAKTCAEKLCADFAETDHTLIYSLSGKGRRSQLDCEVRVGGFGGVAGLVDYIGLNKITMLLDITHPYAVQISKNAKTAADAMDIPLWAYRRPPWLDELYATWMHYSRWSELMGLLKPYRSPFFSIGQSPIEYIAEIPRNQHWTIRCAHKTSTDVASLGGQYTVLESIGPFNLEEELALFQTRKIDVLVTKNSGGNSISAKLEAARQLGIPVCVLKRPGLEKAHREFDNIAVLRREILYHSQLNR